MRKLGCVLLLMLVAGCGETPNTHKSSAKEQPNRQEFQKHLDAQGGWYGIRWSGQEGRNTMSVRVKHDVNGATYLFKVYRRDSGDLFESIYLDDNESNMPVWMRGPTEDVGNVNFLGHGDSLSSREKHDLRRLAEQLWDAFNGS